MKKIAAFASVIVAFLLAVPAQADIFLTTPGVVGTIEAGTQSSNVTNELQWAQYLLDLGKDVSETVNGTTYKTSSVDYSATLTGGTQVSDSTNAPYEWVLAKYDGKEAGYVLFNMTAFGSYTLPATSESIWLNEANKGYELSHFTYFSIPPDPPEERVPDGGMTLVLLGAGLVGLEALRRQLLT